MNDVLKKAMALNPNRNMPLTHNEINEYADLVCTIELAVLFGSDKDITTRKTIKKVMKRLECPRMVALAKHLIQMPKPHEYLYQIIGEDLKGNTVDSLIEYGYSLKN